MDYSEEDIEIPSLDEIIHRIIHLKEIKNSLVGIRDDAKILGVDIQLKEALETINKSLKESFKKKEQIITILSNIQKKVDNIYNEYVIDPINRKSYDI
jgi:hypothetical protein